MLFNLNSLKILVIEYVIYTVIKTLFARFIKGTRQPLEDHIYISMLNVYSFSRLLYIIYTMRSYSYCIRFFYLRIVYFSDKKMYCYFNTGTYGGYEYCLHKRILNLHNVLL